jgi:predicted alpha/beta superfamily hydrolase
MSDRRIEGTMDRCCASNLVFLLISVSLAIPGLVHADAQTGRLQIHELKSDIFSNTRNIRVWLPPSYDHPDNAGRRYPVLYLNDGQDLFDADSSVYFNAEWQVDESLPPLIEGGAIEPLVVVGIDHAGRQGRAREYLPWPDEHLSPPEPSPMGKRYADFLTNDVIPFIEDRYAVRTDKAGRTIGGSSYGALIALYVASKRPELFSQLLLESPSLYVDNDHILGDVTQYGLSVDRVYLGVGTNEVGAENCDDNATNELAVAGVRNLSNILLQKGLRADRLNLTIEECATHSPTAWGRRFPAAVSFLFGDSGTDEP